MIEAHTITGGTAGMNTTPRRSRNISLRGVRYISVEIRIYPEVEPTSVEGWSGLINQAVGDVINCCASKMISHNASARKETS